MRLPWKSKPKVRFETPIESPIRESTLSLQRERPPEFDKEYAEEDTINTFRRALEEADAQAVEYISSVNDFAPIREKVRRSSKKRRDITREGWAYHVSRWPLLVLVFTLITLEFLAYILVRQLVNIIELFSGWRGDIGQLRLKLRRSKSYAEWKETAIQLDELLGYEAWKRTPANAYYDSGLVRRVTESLKEMREGGDTDGVCAVLEVCLRSNFAGIESARVYSETYFGTKDRIRDYISEVEHSLEYIRKTNDLSPEQKIKFFRYVTKNNGSTALCLSGGASFGYYHFGVVRAMLDANLLPKVITGTSAGALVAAFVCTHTDEELRRLLIPELAEKITACEEPMSVWMKRLWKTGARFDAAQWARKSSFFTNGSMTFKEAYERTGRILNVSVIPYDTHSPTKLLNVHTAPNCLILTAIIASAAVPGILNPVVLMTKDHHGNVKPWQFQGRHKDGSLRVDIPLQSLHLFFNVTYSIISQVNPHIHLFFFQPRGAPGKPVSHRKGKGWRGGFFLSAAEQFLKLDLTKNFRVIRDLELMPELMGQNWSGVFLQKFEGSVTIWPRSRLRDWTRLLSDPDDTELARMLQVGQLVTWPKLHMIENRMRIERQIAAGRAECRAQHAQSKQAAAGYNTSSSAQINQNATDSSDDSESDIDLGGPEANAPLPDNDETNNDIEEEEDNRRAKYNDRSRRAASAPASSPSNLAGSSRKRRKQIISRLGLSSSDHGSPMATPSTEPRAFDFANLNSDNERDEDTRNAGPGVSIGRRGPTEKTLRRRLSTGQLRLGKRNNGRVSGGVFGSDNDETPYGEEAESETSFGRI